MLISSSSFSVIKYIYNSKLNKTKQSLINFVDMNFEQSLASVNADTETTCVIPKSSVLIKNRFRTFFGIPKKIDGENIDHENCVWCMFDI